MQDANARQWLAPGLRTYPVATLLPASSAGARGFVRIANESDFDATVTVTAYDDEGTRYDGAELTVEPGAPLALWRLVLRSTEDLEVGAYARMPEGAISPTHAPTPSTSPSTRSPNPGTPRSASHCSRAPRANSPRSNSSPAQPIASKARSATAPASGASPYALQRPSAWPPSSSALAERSTTSPSEPARSIPPRRLPTDRKP